MFSRVFAVLDWELQSLVLVDRTCSCRNGVVVAPALQRSLLRRDSVSAFGKAGADGNDDPMSSLEAPPPEAETRTPSQPAKPDTVSRMFAMAGEPTDDTP